MRRSSLFALIAVSVLVAQAPPALRPGALTDGSELLPTGWRIQPAGKQVALGAFPLNSALSPDGKFLATAGSNSVSVVRLDSLAEVSRTSIPEAWQGITFSADGRNLYVGSGAHNSVFEYLFSPGASSATSPYRPRDDSCTPRICFTMKSWCLIRSRAA
jgi:WD40 repeat protein